jgi:hypothetical protein
MLQTSKANLPQNNSCRNQGSYDNRRYEVKFSRPPGIKARIAAASVTERGKTGEFIILQSPKTAMAAF